MFGQVAGREGRINRVALPTLLWKKSRRRGNRNFDQVERFVPELDAPLTPRTMPEYEAMKRLGVEEFVREHDTLAVELDRLSKIDRAKCAEGMLHT